MGHPLLSCDGHLGVEVAPAGLLPGGLSWSCFYLVVATGPYNSQCSKWGQSSQPLPPWHGLGDPTGVSAEKAECFPGPEPS